MENIVWWSGFWWGEEYIQEDEEMDNFFKEQEEFKDGYSGDEYDSEEEEKVNFYKLIFHGVWRFNKKRQHRLRCELYQDWDLELETIEEDTDEENHEIWLCGFSWAEDCMREDEEIENFFKEQDEVNKDGYSGDEE